MSMATNEADEGNEKYLYHEGQRDRTIVYLLAFDQGCYTTSSQIERFSDRPLARMQRALAAVHRSISIHTGMLVTSFHILRPVILWNSAP